MSDSRSGSIQNQTPAAGDLSDAERELLRDSIRDFLASRWPAQHAVVRSKDAQAIAALWREMSAQGWTALGADPAEGGMREIALAFEELGRASCPAPLLGAVAANLTLAPQRASSEIAGSLLDALRQGKAWIAVAYGAFDGDPAAGRVELDNDARGVESRSCVLNGRVAFVEGAAGATHFLVFSDAPAGAAIVAAGAQGLSIDETPGLAVPALCELSFHKTPAAFLAMSSEAIEDIALVGRLACAARAIGAAQRAFELAVEHAKIRRQFGQYIGQFQAIQHKLADCLMSLDGARLTLVQAAAARDTGDANWRAFGSAALAFAGPSIREVSIQTHRALGAIGYAEEHEAPRHFRRVHADLARFGGAPRVRAELANFVLGDEVHSKAAVPAQASASPVSAFRREVRAWLAKNWTQERRAAHDRRPFDKHGWDPEFSRVLGRDGWIGAGWPREFGGQGRSPSEQIAFIEEMARVGAPHLAHNIGETIVARALFLYGSPEQKAEYLPAILRGERSFSLGYSEPEAGSDLAALRSRAVREGDDWIVNGQKIWSTSADKAEYIWLAVRTDPEAKKHAGISVFMVDLRTPGIGIRPGFALYGKTFSTVFFDNVRVPSHAMVGGVNSGWKVITDALAAERIMMGVSRKALIERAFEHMIAYLKTAGGKVLKDDPIIRDRVGALAAEIEVARQLLMRNAAILEQGRVPIYEAAVSKVFSSELQERLGQAAIDILGTGATLSREAHSAPVGELEQVLRHSLMGIISGGTNEIQRTLIAQRGLGLPR